MTTRLIKGSRRQRVTEDHNPQYLLRAGFPQTTSNIDGARYGGAV